MLLKKGGEGLFECAGSWPSGAALLSTGRAAAWWKRGYATCRGCGVIHRVGCCLVEAGVCDLPEVRCNLQVRGCGLAKLLRKLRERGGLLLVGDVV